MGSVIALSDENGDVVERYEYDVFGKPTIRNAAGGVISESAYGNCRLFTGHEYDYETGNYYYRARYYNPEIGRFLQPDPIGYDDGLNIYTYVENNPINFVDPWGLATLYYWSPSIKSSPEFPWVNILKGHLSMTLDDGTHISHWPNPGEGKAPFYLSPVTPWHPSDLESDIALEGPPSGSTKVSDLDEEAIKEWWEKHKGELKFSFHNHCADVIKKALEVGGKPLKMGFTPVIPGTIFRRSIERRPILMHYRGPAFYY